MITYYVKFPPSILPKIGQNPDMVVWNHIATHRQTGEMLLICASETTNDFNSLNEGGKELDMLQKMAELPSDYQTHWLQVFEPNKPISEIQESFTEFGERNLVEEILS